MAMLFFLCSNVLLACPISKIVTNLGGNGAGCNNNNNNNIALAPTEMLQQDK